MVNGSLLEARFTSMDTLEFSWSFLFSDVMKEMCLSAPGQAQIRLSQFRVADHFRVVAAIIAL